jgi:hypothetical protein
MSKEKLGFTSDPPTYICIYIIYIWSIYIYGQYIYICRLIYIYIGTGVANFGINKEGNPIFEYGFNPEFY